MKIGLLRPPAGIGGAETTMIELYRYLEDAGHDVWLALDGDQKGPFEGFIDRSLFSAKAHALIGLVIADEQYSEEYLLRNLEASDILIILQYRMLSEKVKEALLSYEGRKVIYVPGKNNIHITSPVGDSLNVELFLFNSKETLRHHISGGHNTKVSKKFRYANPPMYLKAYEEIRNIDYKQFRLDRWGIPRNEFSIGVIGRIQPSKLPLEAISIFKRMESRYGYFGFPRKLYFYGSGDKEYMSKIRSAVSKHNLDSYVKFCGFSADTRYEIRSMDCMLHCCKMESLSRGIRESMALKTPVVAYDGFGTRSLLHNLSRDLLFRSEDEAASHLICLGTSGAQKRRFSNGAYQDLLDIENRREGSYCEVLGV